MTLKENEFKIADKATRFANHICDTIVFFLIIFLHAMILDGLLGVIPKEGSFLLGIYYFTLYVLYHALFEYFSGKTPGKYITKTHVVTNDGQIPSFKNIIGRNLFRLIPFDNLTFLFSNIGWHDELSKTTVVQDKYDTAE